MDIKTSVPCRIDLGGTLDISTFYYPLRCLNPCTFNIALDLRTEVRLLPYKKGKVKVSSRGFKSAEYVSGKAPFDHPMGLMFAVAHYFNADGVHIDICSSSPPRSALGGSSSAAVALAGAFSKLFIDRSKRLSIKKTAMLAHYIEGGVAGVPCGMQDQLAAAYGGVNAWCWGGSIDAPLFKQETVIKKTEHRQLEKHLVIAYCGIPHESRDINSKWVKQFLKGKNREQWINIVSITHQFIKAISAGNYKNAALFMNEETAIRKKMTPDVLDAVGRKLVGAAARSGCGARFTGAGGGGCLWAIGEQGDIAALKHKWRDILSLRKGACLLEPKVASKGLIYH